MDAHADEFGIGDQLLQLLHREQVRRAVKADPLGAAMGCNGFGHHLRPATRHRPQVGFRPSRAPVIHRPDRARLARVIDAARRMRVAFPEGVVDHRRHKRVLRNQVAETAVRFRVEARHHVKSIARVAVVPEVKEIQVVFLDQVKNALAAIGIDRADFFF